MTDHHNDHDQNDQENHDDCQDCKRQRAQNDKLIEIYQKLQQVDQRTSNMKSSVIVHKDRVQKSFEIVKKMDQKVEKIKTNKQEQNKSHFQQLGFTLFADIIEKQKKSQVQKENQRLKQIIKNLYDQRSKLNQQTYPKSVEKKKDTLKQTSSLFQQLEKSEQKTAAKWFSKGPVTSRSESRKSSSFRDTEMGKSFEIFSTKSTFNMTKRKTFEKKDFEQLNLWLFEQRNQILEKQLYDKSIKQNIDDQVLKQRSIFKQSRSQRYSHHKGKNTGRLNESIILNSTHLRRPNHFIKQESNQSNIQRNNYYFSIKNSHNIETIKSVMPQYQPNSSNRFLNKRPKLDTILPSINNK